MDDDDAASAAEGLKEAEATEEPVPRVSSAFFAWTCAATSRRALAADGFPWARDCCRGCCCCCCFALVSFVFGALAPAGALGWAARAGGAAAAAERSPFATSAHFFLPGLLAPLESVGELLLEAPPPDLDSEPVEVSSGGNDLAAGREGRCWWFPLSSLSDALAPPLPPLVFAALALALLPPEALFLPLLFSSFALALAIFLFPPF
mmetsp:Transcript_18726/g.37856  ORF Transcript_18726/g.37856 Transcript_18726/m.37856 type:complete len:206 (+) Transcript_18726:489-1106(+)